MPDTDNKSEGVTKEGLTEVLSEDPESNEDMFAESFEEFASDGPPKEAGIETPPTPEPEPETPAASGEMPTPDSRQGSASATEDIWAKSTPEQKAAFDAATTDAHKWNSDRGRAAADARRIAGLESQLSAASDAKKAEAAQSESSLAKTLSGEDWKAVESELPEIATPLKKVLEGFQSENVALKKEVSTLSDSRRGDNLEAQVKIVSDEHPDWESVTDDRFLQWAGSQPRFVQEMVNRNAERVVDGHETAHVLKLFKESDSYVPPVPENPSDGSQEKVPATKLNGGTPNKRDRDSQRRLEGNVSIPSKGPGAPSGPPDEFNAAFDHYARQGA